MLNMLRWLVHNRWFDKLTTNGPVILHNNL